MSFSSKKLFQEINNKYDVKNSEYIKDAIKEIDITINNTTIDSDFYNEYYKLKRDMKIYDVFTTSAVFGILTGIFTAFALDTFQIINTYFLAFLVYSIALLFCFILSFFMIKHFFNKHNCVLQPYLLKKMEDKICNKNSNRKKYIKVVAHRKHK